ncbi:DinB family protein [Neolewinella persica]|uniref:DinB family protein n=1 Tax=Neolewinella persica TaxID=70998 RepID=UPI000380C093|nr:DinB family protein [Neolewinella persica]
MKLLKQAAIVANVLFLALFMVSCGEHEHAKGLDQKSAATITDARSTTASQGLKVKQIKFDGDLKAKAELDEEERGKTKSFWDGRASVSRILNFTLDHVTHHRGQTTVYLRMCGHSAPDYVVGVN